jgi:aminoglycoside/choline kinase family phosphotransferase
MDETSPPKASADVLPELAAFLAPFAPLLHNAQSRHTLHRYLTGLLSDLPRKNCDTIAATVAGTSPERLQRLLTDARWDALMTFWYQGPLTLVHGDSHLANCFEYATPAGPRMGMLDFQAVHWSKGIRDVQYFLIHSLEPDVLAAHEDALIDHYLAELARFGVTLDAAEAREQYCAFSFQTLMVGVVSLGLGGLTERADTVRTCLRREVAAIERLRFGEWLDGLR